MWGIWESPRKGLFGDVWVMAWVAEPYFFDHWSLPLTVCGFFACSGQVSDKLHCTVGMWTMMVIEPLVLIT